VVRHRTAGGQGAEVHAAGAATTDQAKAYTPSGRRPAWMKDPERLVDCSAFAQQAPTIYVERVAARCPRQRSLGGRAAALAERCEHGVETQDDEIHQSKVYEGERADPKK